MTKQLEGKTALITGGTTGIGLATARRFAEEGARLIVTGRNPDTLAAARAALGDAAEVIASDAGDPAAIARLFEHVRGRWERLDVLFFNAGIARFAPLADLGEEDFDATFAVNIKGPWLALRHALPLLGEGSSVLFNTSVLDRKGMPGASAYAASKAALRSLVRTAAAELSSLGVRVNAISPGPVETPIYGKLGFDSATLDSMASGLVQQVPLGRFGTPDELASAALFLASPQSSFVQGSVIEVDGGLAQI